MNFITALLFFILSKLSWGLMSWVYLILALVYMLLHVLDKIRYEQNK